MSWEFIKEVASIGTTAALAVGVVGNWVRQSEMLKQTQKSVAELKDECKVCRSKVHDHHEDQDKHTSAATLTDIVNRLGRIEASLMRLNGGSNHV